MEERTHMYKGKVVDEKFLKGHPQEALFRFALIWTNVVVDEIEKNQKTKK